ncbi:hypothetical protein BDA96_05G010100 [Sorghum bicolor]|uniref:Bifunctional inhibitor/plant lipid transfer protein/seed storage helical domain-containing protein n=2 Tax=Sorghum bicolor TaxID=4558 RepID=A0A921QV40_SORBI|nr:hypothetical protein BDA96_05G010100 [Sorghum bicolor]KAG0528422.1 hypothetical protein BDA96_05G010100 [Sorghum bicolor]
MLRSKFLPNQSIAHSIEMALLLLMMTAVLLLQQQALATGGGDPSFDELRYRRHRGFRHRNAPPQTPTAPAQPVHPPPPPPTTRHCNDTLAPEESLTASGDVCVPVPAPSPPVPPPRRGLRCPPCTCPRPPQPPRPFPGWPVPRPLPVPVPVPVPGSKAGGDAGYDCVTPLAPLTTCGEFITGNDTETPAPTGACCSALAAFLRASSAPAAAGGGDHMLRCLCPVILGDVNKVLPKPVDPVRMMYLPIACGVVLPPQVLYVCFTGRPSPTNFPQSSGTGSDPSP